MTKNELLEYVGVRISSANPNDLITANEVRDSILSVATYTEDNFVAKNIANLSISGTITAGVNIKGISIIGSSFQIDGKPFAITSAGFIYLNASNISNSSANTGIYLGYGNNESAANRIYDGGTANYIGLSSATFSSPGITKFLFGTQTDDQTFAQFAGAVKIKNNLTVNGSSGTFSTDNVQSNLYYLNITRQPVSLTTAGSVGVGTTSPIERLTTVSENPDGQGTYRDFDVIQGTAGVYSYMGAKIGTTLAASTSFLSLLETGGNSGSLQIQTRTAGVLSTKMFIGSNGYIGIGTNLATSKLHVSGLPVYADNTSATAGGLTLGAFYRTSIGDLKVVF